jgi:hypothetical protein
MLVMRQETEELHVAGMSQVEIRFVSTYSERHQVGQVS